MFLAETYFELVTGAESDAKQALDFAAVQNMLRAANLQPDDAVAMLSFLGVDGEYRCRGIGSRILQELLKSPELAAKGLRQVWVSPMGHPAAAHFYASKVRHCKTRSFYSVICYLLQ